jgi:hypothetical protein
MAGDNSRRSRHPGSGCQASTAVQLMNGDVLPTFEDADAAPAPILSRSLAGLNCGGSEASSILAQFKPPPNFLWIT